MTLRREPTWGGLATSGPAGNGADDSAAPRADGDGQAGDDGPLEELEGQVFTARDLHGEERTKARRRLAQARKRMSEQTYRRALVLARDTVLLTIEECVNGALAMEWDPLPRPEFSLAAIEAAVADQERAEELQRQLSGREN